eukprot:5709306-Amphidinium_carterae.1
MPPHDIDSLSTLENSQLDFAGVASAKTSLTTTALFEKGITMSWFLAQTQNIILSCFCITRWAGSPSCSPENISRCMPPKVLCSNNHHTYHMICCDDMQNVTNEHFSVISAKTCCWSTMTQHARDHSFQLVGTRLFVAEAEQADNGICGSHYCFVLDCTPHALLNAMSNALTQAAAYQAAAIELQTNYLGVSWSNEAGPLLDA